MCSKTLLRRLCCIIDQGLIEFSHKTGVHCWLVNDSEEQTNTVFENRRKSLINIASEASYVYILSGQKFIKNAKKRPFCHVFDNLKLVVK